MNISSLQKCGTRELNTDGELAIEKMSLLVTFDFIQRQNLTKILLRREILRKISPRSIR